MPYRRLVILLCVLLLLGPGFVSLGQTLFGRSARVTIGSKAFTESVILGDVATQLLEHDNISAVHNRQLGGTRVLWSALLAGNIDAYPEYTGTITQELLPESVSKNSGAKTDTQLRAALAEQGIGMTDSLGFNDTYAIGVSDARAEQLGLGTIGDLRKHPDLTIGLSNEFLDRSDGWPLVRDTYRLPQKNVTGLDHDLAYRALAGGTIDATDLYSTDAEIDYYKLRVLADDQHIFPEYRAVFLYRLDLQQRAPAAVAALRKLSGTIDAPRMIAMNARAKLEKIPEPTVAGSFLQTQLGVAPAAGAGPASPLARLWQRTREHLTLVDVSLLAAIAVAVPVGAAAARWRRGGQLILGVVAAIYTIPSLALLVFMIPLFGIGFWPAVVALFLYSLLPIVRNTHAGLTGIPQATRESAQVLGLSGWYRLTRVDLPLALPSILAGIKTSAVINVGTATLGALIGAGGYGQPIITGIRLDDVGLILFGAIPAAVLALLVQGLFELLERHIVPPGLRPSR